MVTAGRYLIATSAHARLWRPDIRPGWEEPLLAGQVAVCEPTSFEILRAARSGREYGSLAEQLSHLYLTVPVPDGAWTEVLTLQGTLADAGLHHAAGVVDLLVMVTARRHGLTILHYDPDVETVARHADVTTRWVAEPGSVP